MDWEQIYLRFASDTNDAQAWAALERRVRVWARAVFWQDSPNAIDDVVADTCAAVALGISRARGAETFAGFAYGHFLNARKRMLRSHPPGWVPLGAMDVAAPLEEDELDPDTVTQLHHALAALPQRECAAVTLRYFDELPSTRIAVELGVTDVNARRILCNGMRRLRATLGSRHARTESNPQLTPRPRVTRFAPEVGAAPAR
jgi:RNA polymerase sigma factor (sigma-70 family)